MATTWTPYGIDDESVLYESAGQPYEDADISYGGQYFTSWVPHGVDGIELEYDDAGDNYDSSIDSYDGEGFSNWTKVADV